MQISNVPDLDAVDDLEKSLATISGVRAVKMSGDYKDGKVEFEVGFLGSSRELGRALGSTTYKKKKLVVTTVQNNRLEVAIAK
jgi:carbon monoxide dehydrogenase subunit G